MTMPWKDPAVNREKRNEYMRDTRAWRRDNHYCTTCGGKDAFTMSGRAQCAVCAEKRQAYGKIWADGHREQLRERDRTRSRNRKAAGLCVKCGQPLDGDPHSSCAACRGKDARRHREARGGDMRGVGGLCAQCGKAAALEGRKLCPACYERACAALIKARAGVDRKTHPWRSEREAMR